MLKGRDIIIYLALKYDGDWNQIYQAIKEKELVDEPLVQKKLAALTSQVVTIIDDDYPDSLKKIYKPPFVLFYYGDLQLTSMMHKTIGVIGSRQPSTYGKMMTESISKELLEEGMIIVSGMAKGIDTVAHTTALLTGGKTIAVLGSGIDHCYPKENINLYQNLKDDHLILSEYPHHVAPNKEHFPWRNRIIAGLAKSLFVAEAKQKSGTLITVGYALYLGKDVYVLPHHANTDNSTNQLIKDGAILVESGKDIMEHMHGQFEQKQVELSTLDPQKKFI
jgi:DNA processing protein